MTKSPEEFKLDYEKGSYEYECSKCGDLVRTRLKFAPDESHKDCGGILKRVKFSGHVFQQPREEVMSIEQLQKIITDNFPSIWFETRACLSAYCTLALKNLNGCPSLNLIGAPSGEKTTILSFFYGDRYAYISDDFTPRAFVSHASNVKADDLEKVDLLPRIRNKVLVTPELAPLFESPKDKLIDNFSMLTRVLDGEGLNRDSGSHGHRGYSGDYKFVWLGASTPIRSSVWKVMGKIGNRLFFLNVRDKNRSDKDYLEMFQGRAYEDKVFICRGAVRSFLNNFFKRNKVRSVEWDAEGDILLLPELVKYARLLARLRASLMTWRGEEKGQYEYSFPIIEEPPRAINSLYNLAKGHALIHGRNYLKSEDLEIIREVAFSSLPQDRYEFLKLLIRHEGRLTAKQIEDELFCSRDTALRTMKTFEILKLVRINELGADSVGRPLKYVEMEKEFMALFSHAQGKFDEINNKSHEIIPVRDVYSEVKVKDIIGFTQHSQVGIDEINNKSHKKTPVSETNFSPEEAQK